MNTMDLGSIIGFIVAMLLVTVAILLGGGSLAAFAEPASLAIVVGGMAAATMISFPLKNFLNLFSICRKVFVWNVDSAPGIIHQLVSLAETARRDGLLKLEDRLIEVENPFIALGIQMAVDGTRPEVMEDILRTEFEAVANRHREGKALLETMGRYAPAYGMIGTLLGLIIMLGDMSDPSKIGAGMAVALLTTLYGAVAANAFLLPFADKLGFTSRKELLTMEIAIRGILAIQAGENPRVIQQKLMTFVPPAERETDEQAAA